MDEHPTTRRIRQARETLAALARIGTGNSSRTAAVQLHKTHAKHLRENGDPEGARRAEARAAKADGEYPPG